MKRLVMISMLVALAVATVAQAELPPGKWWKNPQIAQRLALEPEQQARLDAIFRDTANDLIDRRAEVEKLQLAMRGELDQAQLNRQNLQRLAAQLTQARGKLFERELMMLVDMRGVLNNEQWELLRAHIDRRPQPPRGRRRP